MIENRQCYLDFLGRFGSSHGIGSDGGVSIAIHLLQAVGSDAVLQKLTELLLVSLDKQQKRKHSKERL